MVSNSQLRQHMTEWLVANMDHCHTEEWADVLAALNALKAVASVEGELLPIAGGSGLTPAKDWEERLAAWQSKQKS